MTLVVPSGQITEGTDVVIQCRVPSPPTASSVTWQKRLASGATVVIGTNAGIQTPFRETSRYEMTERTEPQVAKVFILTIKGRHHYTST